MSDTHYVKSHFSKLRGLGKPFFTPLSNNDWRGIAELRQIYNVGGVHKILQIFYTRPSIRMHQQDLVFARSALTVALSRFIKPYHWNICICSFLIRFRCI